MDGDGDLDLVVGDFYGALRSWRREADGSYTPLTDTANPLKGISVGNYSSPSFVDLDGDGDLDLVVGNSFGTLRSWRRDGNGSYTELTGTANPFNGIGVGSISAPSFSDLDGDGAPEAVVGISFGSPTVFALQNAGRNTLDGGAGDADWASYAPALFAVTVNLGAGSSAGAQGQDSLTGIENILGGSGDDSLVGDGNANVLAGGNGADSLSGGAGNDSLAGNGGVDLVSYAELTAATQAVTVDLITQRATGAVGADTLSSIENALGGEGDDSLLGDGNANLLNGGAGNDTLLGGLGVDTLAGGLGDDWLDFGDGTESFTYALGMGDDTLDGGAGTDSLNLGAGTWTPSSDGAWTTFTQGSTRLYVRNWENMTLQYAPVGPANIVLTPLAEDTLVTLTTADLLAGWSDGNGTTLSVLNLTASSGTLTNLGAGSWRFLGATNDDTSVSFSYQVSDGTVAIATTATLDLTPVNDVPSVTSGGTASFAENGTGAAYQAAGSDPDAGTTLSWSLAGTDAALFNINAATGAVTFKTSPNFEAPADVGGNNVYDITITTSDSVLTSAPQAVAISVTDVTGPGQTGTSESEVLTVGVGAENAQLSGLGGNDTLTGGAGRDTLDGGDGNDVFVISDSLDLIIETAGGGADTIITSVTMSMPDHVETLQIAAGISGVTIAGGSGNDMLIGNGLANAFVGGAGDDVILAGNVTLSDVYALFTI
ncbi:MAG: VCBS repeat-containing protein [Roseomonas sp.]|nr:VCBS repeat-containing protein [Roseomonas sp.]MCA3292647.1 VCBS repeat-containing protein [Roseomonas sp.]MCA3295679.1 VCBS repeat-containing protein [Roseomonas sp.]